MGFKGKYCSGEGDENFLRLIDESFEMLHPSPSVPNISMLYKPEWDAFAEGAGWRGWWIQNSYGFAYSATPFLAQPWFSILQRSMDLLWDNQADGKRMGCFGKGINPNNRLYSLVAPDGCLGDCAHPGGIAYKQGDGHTDMHEWFYEATAAGVVMQAEILLRSRDAVAVAKYLPKMARACDFIERARDPKNNLFLVGPACNLLAPSYGGVLQPDGAFGKGYLAGLSITYLAALNRMVELHQMTGDVRNRLEYERRRNITQESLALLKTDEGYFVKSIEPDGTKHGVLGQDQYGYLEGVVNVDAVGLGVVDNRTAETIYNRIASFPEIRPFDFLLTNAPGLDDTYWAWGKSEGPEFVDYMRFGDWVNGGAWGTVEGRAILAYFRLGKFADAYRSAVRAMKWAKDYRMDEPWCQRGENTMNYWSDRGCNQVGGVSVMVDNFAIPAATLRGLFGYEYRSDRLTLYPRVPGGITHFVQDAPLQYGAKTLFLCCQNGGPLVRSVRVNGCPWKIDSPDRVDLPYEALPEEAHVEIATTGDWPTEPPYAPYPATPVLASEEVSSPEPLPPALQSLRERVFALRQRLKDGSRRDEIGMLADAALACIEAYRIRRDMDVGPGHFRAITPERRAGIISFHEQAAINLCNSPALSDDAGK
ncbi:MAG: hypothetical protein PHR35_18175 [Kiritimatiellae bacterium]|nr:hypothetical protein [Kiritimatiellia bacterium]